MGGDDKVSRFFESFPTKQQQVHSMESQLYPSRRVFWRQINSSAVGADDVKKKVISAFGNVTVPRIRGLLQFWAPVVKDGQVLLSTFDQPFALENFDPVLKSCRLSCLNYQYGGIDNDNLAFENDENEMINVGGGLIAAAFVNGFPDVVLDLRLHKGSSPLVDVAIDCGLTCCILIPVFDRSSSSSSSSSCVGVVECCMKVHGLLRIFKELKHALESVGLSTYSVREWLPYETMHDLKGALYETQEALKIVCESLDLSIGQVWIPFRQNKNHVPFPCSSISSSSCMETTTTRGGGFAVKLCGYCIDSDDDDITDYYDTCDVLPLKICSGSKSLAARTLETYEPHLCRNLSNLRSYKESVFGYLTHTTKSSSLSICLRNIHTRDDIDYVFEFLWPKCRDPFIVLESLLLTLKKCLPSFKFAAGPQQLVGDDENVRVQVVRDSILIPLGFLNISQTFKLPPPRPPMPPTLLAEWKGTKVVKRKFCYVDDGECLTDPESDSDSEYWGDDCDDLFVRAEYRGNATFFILQSTYTLENAKENVEEAFNLDPDTYSLECKPVDDKDIVLNTDQDFSSCIKLWKTAQKKKGGQNTRFKVHVIQKSQHQLDNVPVPSSILDIIPKSNQGQKHVQKPSESAVRRRVFWSQHESKSSPSSDDWVIHEKIKQAFLSSTNVFPLKGIIIQFWAPVVTTNGKRLLSTLDQPFSIGHFNTRTRKYWKTCLRYKYSIVQLKEEEAVENMLIINSGGPPETAFLNGYPEVVVDMVHNKWKGNRLMDYALKYELTCSFVLPVFHLGSSSCVGVVECSMQRSSGLLVMFNQLKRALEQVGLSIYRADKESSPPPPIFKTMLGLKRAADEIEIALKMVCESHDLALGQVWIPFSSASTSPSSMVVDEDSERMFLFKLNGYSVDYHNDRLSPVKDFYDSFNVLPLKKGEGLAGNTLKTYRPHLCTRNHLANLTCDNNCGLLSILSASTKHRYTCLVVCLRSIHTGDDVDYVFEFIWHTRRNHLILMDSLLSTLKSFCPSFKFASSSSDGLPPAPVVMVVNDDTTADGGLSLPTTKKRKLSSQRDLLMRANNHHEDDDDDDDDLVIVATYEKRHSLILVPNTSSLANLREKINEDFKLDTTKYTLHFQDDDSLWGGTRLHPLDGHESFQTCISLWNKAKKSYIKLHVTQVD